MKLEKPTKIENPLLRQLSIIAYLSRQWGGYAHQLAKRFQVSEITIKRDIAACRHLGAEIVADSQGGYRLMNGRAIMGKVLKWSRLERERDRRLESGL